MSCSRRSRASGPSLASSVRHRGGQARPRAFPLPCVALDEENDGRAVFHDGRRRDDADRRQGLDRRRHARPVEDRARRADGGAWKSRGRDRRDGRRRGRRRRLARRRGCLPERRQHREVGLEVRSRLEARHRVLRKRLVNDRDELGRDACHLPEVVRRRLRDVLHRDYERRLAVVRNTPREALVGHDANRIDVAPGVGGSPERLLRRHVVRRPDHHAVERELLVRLPAREPEIEDRDGARVLDHHVLRLEVAVDDPELVRGLAPERDLAQDRDRARLREKALGLDDRPEVLPRDILHRDVREVTAHPEVVNARDVRVLDLAVQVDLALEPLEELLVVRLPVRGEDLDRDDLLEVEILRLEDNPHAPAADRLEPAVAGESFEELLPEALEVHGGGCLA